MKGRLVWSPILLVPIFRCVSYHYTNLERQTDCKQSSNYVIHIAVVNAKFLPLTKYKSTALTKCSPALFMALDLFVLTACTQEVRLHLRSQSVILGYTLGLYRLFLLALYPCAVVHRFRDTNDIRKLYSILFHGSSF